MFDDIENAELETEFLNRLSSPEFLTCKTEKAEGNCMTTYLATWDEMSLDATKCVIIRLPDGKRIYEWFRGEVNAYSIKNFISKEKVEYEDPDSYELKIIWDNDPNNDRLLILEQTIRSQCPGSRLNLRLVPKQKKAV